nr:hypothetical protein [Tissierella sp.]
MMPKKFKELEYLRMEKLINGSDVFNADTGGGVFRKKVYPFVLKNSDNNLFSEIKESVEDYFHKNNISWWNGKKVTNHTLSSQVACLNHLFAIRDNKEAVLSFINKVDPNIKDVLLIDSDEHLPAYIQFEAISDTDHLNEIYSTRGSNCTSLDALIYGLRKDGTKVIFPIEWKYTEVYGNENKGLGEKGKTRKKRYNVLIKESKQLKDNLYDTYYYEPFYQLMRQTLWAEEIIHHKDSETIKADDYIHINVIPSENYNLLNKKYCSSEENMETTWRNHLIDQSKYVIISPESVLSSIDINNYKNLIQYLEKRYW